MKIKSDISEEKVVKKPQNEIVPQWSIKRIAIFSSVVGLLIFGIFYFFQVKNGEILGEKDTSSKIGGPQIEIPSKDDVDEILEDAEENISNINPDDIVSSQPQIQNAIEQLERLTNRDNFKEMFCSTVCSD